MRHRGNFNMNNKDNKLIYEAYIAEKVTELSDAHLADIRAKFYPDDGDAMFDNVIAPALRASLKSGELDSETWAHTGTDVDTDGLRNHLETLRYGTLGALTRRGMDAIKDTGKKLKHAATKELGRYKIQSPITRRKY